MNIFKPYQVLKDDADCIHLQQSALRSSLLRTFFFVGPFLLLICAVAMPLVMLDTDFSVWPQVAFVAIMAVCIYLMLRAEVVLEVMITPVEIRQRYLSLLKTRRRLIMVADAQSVMLEKIYVRSRGYYFFLSMKDGSKKVLFSLPRFAMDPSEEETIRQKLERCTGMRVEKFTL